MLKEHSQRLNRRKKGIFTTLEITQSLNIDDNGSFISSGNMFSSGSIVAVHGKYKLYMLITCRV